ncbi:unnamed protein product [Pedinophyceae sp. YPF-701]|nr:unnamed protein product [Pedinophyceae sp. YPF-701]
MSRPGTRQEVEVQRMRQLIHEYMVRSCQTILAARLLPIDLGTVASSKDHRGRCWFNLEDQDSSVVTEELNQWRVTAADEIVIEVFLQRPEAQSDDELLERWYLGYTQTPSAAHRDAMHGATPRQVAARQAPGVYKRMIISLRSLMTLLRALPAHRLCRELRLRQTSTPGIDGSAGASAHTPRVSFRVLGATEAARAMQVHLQQSRNEADPCYAPLPAGGGPHGERIAARTFEPIPWFGGEINMSVEYKSSCLDLLKVYGLSQRSPAAVAGSPGGQPGRIIAEYMASPMRRQQSLPARDGGAPASPVRAPQPAPAPPRAPSPAPIAVHGFAVPASAGAVNVVQHATVGAMRPGSISRACFNRSTGDLMRAAGDLAEAGPATDALARPEAGAPRLQPGSAPIGAGLVPRASALTRGMLAAPVPPADDAQAAMEDVDLGDPSAIGQLHHVTSPQRAPRERHSPRAGGQSGAAMEVAMSHSPHQCRLSEMYGRSEDWKWNEPGLMLPFTPASVGAAGHSLDASPGGQRMGPPSRNNSARGRGASRGSARGAAGAGAAGGTDSRGMSCSPGNNAIVAAGSRHAPEPQGAFDGSASHAMEICGSWQTRAQGRHAAALARASPRHLVPQTSGSSRGGSRQGLRGAGGGQAPDAGASGVSECDTSCGGAHFVPFPFGNAFASENEAMAVSASSCSAGPSPRPPDPRTTPPAAHPPTTPGGSGWGPASASVLHSKIPQYPPMLPAPAPAQPIPRPPRADHHHAAAAPADDPAWHPLANPSSSVPAAPRHRDQAGVGEILELLSEAPGAEEVRAGPCFSSETAHMAVSGASRSSGPDTARADSAQGRASLGAGSGSAEGPQQAAQGKLGFAQAVSRLDRYLEHGGPSAPMPLPRS